MYNSQRQSSVGPSVLPGAVEESNVLCVRKREITYWGKMGRWGRGVESTLREQIQDPPSLPTVQCVTWLARVTPLFLSCSWVKEEKEEELDTKRQDNHSPAISPNQISQNKLQRLYYSCLIRATSFWIILLALTSLIKRRNIRHLSHLIDLEKKIWDDEDYKQILLGRARGFISDIIAHHHRTELKGQQEELKKMNTR